MPLSVSYVEDAAAGSDEQFAAAFSATVAMGEVDARTTWASDMNEAEILLARLGGVWRSLFAAAATASAPAAAEEENNGKKNEEKKKKNARSASASASASSNSSGLARLEPDCVVALSKYLEKLKQRWSGGGNEHEDEDEDEDEDVMNITFDFDPGAAGDQSAPTRGISQDGRGKKRQRE